MLEQKQPIVIKKIVKGHDAHHGGSWKVAFADFATAMMAFFMLLWLLGVTTAEQRGGIADYFKNPSMVEGLSNAPTGAMGPGGASNSLIKLGGLMEHKKPRSSNTEKKLLLGDKYIRRWDNYEQIPMNEKAKIIKEKQRKQREQEIEKHHFDNLMIRLKKAIGENESLSKFKDQLLLDLTPEGLRIQIVDKENRPMFASGSSNLKYYTEEILTEISRFVQGTPNKVSISGHTDAKPFKNKNGYTNWELSADRANAARRALLDSYIDLDKIVRVSGHASTVLFNRDDPKHPSNRRITVLVMNKKTEMALLRSDYNRGTASISEIDPVNTDSTVNSGSMLIDTNRQQEYFNKIEANTEAQSATTQDQNENSLEDTEHPEQNLAPGVRIDKIDLPAIINPSLLPLGNNQAFEK